MVLGEEVVRVGHGLELEVVSTGILEEHGQLLARLTGEPQVRLDDELDALSLDPVSKGAELGDAETDSKVRDRDLVPVNRIEVVLSTIVIPSPVTHKLVSIPEEGDPGGRTRKEVQPLH